MARIKNATPNIRRRNVAYPLMLISIGIVGLIISLLFNFKSQGLGIFKSQLDVVTGKFESVEKTYSNLLTDILSKREPVPDFTLDVIDESYSSLLSEISELELTLKNPNSIKPLKDIIAVRLQSLRELRDMNMTLRTEEIVGNSLTAYNSCKKSISFRQNATTITTKLAACKLELDTAISSLDDLPTASTDGCTLKQSPSYYLLRTLKSHELLVASYTYSSKGKAKESAAKELEYQKVISEIQHLPDWNTCITNYLQLSAKTLLGD